MFILFCSSKYSFWAYWDVLADQILCIRISVFSFGNHRTINWHLLTEIIIHNTALSIYILCRNMFINKLSSITRIFIYHTSFIQASFIMSSHSWYRCMYHAFCKYYSIFCFFINIGQSCVSSDYLHFAVKAILWQFAI